MEWFRNTFEQQVLFPIENAECIELYLSLSDEQKFPDWINSSGKGDPPPDFYNPQINMMMDVMRVDDHGHVVGKGKYINPVNQRESQIQRELRESGFLDMFPNVQSVFVNAVTDLPEREDHNYQFYVENFKRTLEKHIKSIPLYRKNHPRKPHGPINWGIVLTWIIGIIGSLIMGFGMSKVMVGNVTGTDLVVGIITGMVGLIICVLNYPIYSYLKSNK